MLRKVPQTHQVLEVRALVRGTKWQKFSLNSTDSLSQKPLAKCSTTMWYYIVAIGKIFFNNYTGYFCKLFRKFFEAIFRHDQKKVIFS